jgi:hypothetical protein
MELSFSGHSKTTRTVNFDEADLAALTDVVRTYFIQQVAYIDLKNPYSDEDRLLVKLCLKYGVDPLYAPDRLAFFKAVMGER